MERFGSCVLMALFAAVAGQNGPHVPDHGLVATAEGQLYAQPAIVEPRAAEPQGAATGYAPSGKYYGGGGGGGSGNGGYESNSYGGGGHGGGYGGGESGYVGNGGCYGRPAGVYGDASYDCKTFQVCQADGRLDTMYCPPYTRFNNYLGVCDWHFKVDAYCNPLYKEEYNNNYQSSYGGDSYDKGSQNYAPSYGGNSYQQSGNTYEKPSSYGNNQNSYGGNSYSSASTNYGSTGGTGYSSGYRTPVYSLQAYPAQQNSQAQKY